MKRTTEAHSRMLIKSLTLHAQVRTETNQLMTLNAIAEGGNAKRRRVEMRMLRVYAAQPHGSPETCNPE